MLTQKISSNDCEVPTGSSIVVHDATYDEYVQKFQAKTSPARIFYIFAYLIPGIASYVLVNVEPVHLFLSEALGFTGYNFQYFVFIVFTLCWHLAFLIFVLRWHEKLKWVEVFEFLSLNRFSFREILLVAPIAFALSVLLSLPYMMTLYEPVQAWFNSVPGFKIPSYSIFASYDAFYGAPVAVMVLMLIGNFIGEEVYFRGYLMKKTGFLGRFNWFVNSSLFLRLSCLANSANMATGSADHMLRLDHAVQ